MGHYKFGVVFIRLYMQVIEYLSWIVGTTLVNYDRKILQIFVQTNIEWYAGEPWTTTAVFIDSVVFHGGKPSSIHSGFKDLKIYCLIYVTSLHNSLSLPQNLTGYRKKIRLSWKRFFAQKRGRLCTEKTKRNLQKKWMERSLLMNCVTHEIWTRK